MGLLRERFSFVAVTSIVLAAFGCGGSAGTGDESVDSDAQAVETVPQCTMEGCDEPDPGPCEVGEEWVCGPTSDGAGLSSRAPEECKCVPICELPTVSVVVCHGQIQPDGTPLHPGCSLSCLSAM